MVQERYGVQLSTQEKGRLRQMIRADRSSAQAITRARILLKTDQGWTASQVAAALDISERTVFRAKRRYAEEGLDEVLRHRNQVNRYRKLDDRTEAYLIALACSPAPDGHDCWTLRALAGKAVELGLVESLSHETVRLRLKKRAQAPVLQRGRLWRKQQWCIPKVSGKYVAAMEDVLDLSRASTKHASGVLTSSESVRSNWPAEMSHSPHGECDFDSKRTGKTSGPEQFAR